MLIRTLKITIITAILLTVASGISLINQGVASAQAPDEEAALVLPEVQTQNLKGFLSTPVQFIIDNESINIPLMSFLEQNPDGSVVLPNESGQFGLEINKMYVIANFINRYALDAKVYIDEHGKLAISDEKNGMRLNLQKLEKDIRNAITNYDSSPINVEFEIVPPHVKKIDLEQVLPNLNDIISQKITLTTPSEEMTATAGHAISAISKKYNFKIQDNFDALDVNFTSYIDLNGKRIPVSMITDDKFAGTLLKTDWVLGFNMQKIDDYIKNNLAVDLEIPPEDVTITMGDDGRAVFEGTAQNGIIVDRQELISNMLSALNSEDKTATIPLKEVKGNVFTSQELKDRGIAELFSIGYSNFSGSSGKRIHNIKTGIARFNGVIMPKDTVFSFNQQLGPVDASTGYLEELVIKGDTTEPDYGGGLCQVSSTFFRAGLFGGLSIAERKAHSYAVSYYARPGGHGLDCTIYPGVSDCKILNDSPGDLLIQAYMDGNDAYFKFYGTQDGRTVSMEGPYYSNQQAAPPDKIIYDPNLPDDYHEDKEHPHNGFDAIWYRTVVNSLGETSKQTFQSHYQARPKVIIRGGKAPESKTE